MGYHLMSAKTKSPHQQPAFLRKSLARALMALALVDIHDGFLTASLAVNLDPLPPYRDRSEAPCSLHTWDRAAIRLSLSTVYHESQGCAILFPPFLHRLRDVAPIFQYMYRALRFEGIGLDICRVPVGAKGVPHGVLLRPRGVGRHGDLPLFGLALLRRRQLPVQGPGRHPGPGSMGAPRRPCVPCKNIGPSAGSCPWAPVAGVRRPPSPQARRNRTSAGEKSASRSTRWMWYRWSPCRPSMT